MRCSVKNCDRPHIAKGFCNSHYKRVQRHGSAAPERRLKAGPGKPRQWLLQHVEHDGDGCLIWPFARLSSGYGTVEWDGNTVTAHRQMCRLAHGEPPTTKHNAAHNCGNGFLGCIHPKHLRWATPSENEMDKVAHGTDARGERNGFHKLTAADVAYIRQTYRRGVVTMQSLADQLGVNKTAINKVLKGDSWGWLK